MHRPSAVTGRLAGRRTTWALAVWSAYIATWAWASDSRAAIVAVWWLAGVVLVQTFSRGIARPAASAGDTRASRP